jgi:serine/threonine-protein kinase
VLEYLSGGSLDERMTYGERVPDEEARQVAHDLAAGLAHAHERGVVHRDLKPANVLFGASGHAKLADFGLARLGDSPSLTSAGTVLGTAAYMAPEQVTGQQVTAATDVYAFGVIVFRMLTGRLPFEAADAYTLAAMHRDRPPPSVFDLRPDAPARLESLVFAALAKSPSDRPADGRALLAELGVGSRA